MLLRIWRLFSILLTALAFATAFAHLLELAPKLGYQAGLYTSLHRTLYSNYARVGGFAEVAALFAVSGLAWRVRARRRGVFPLTLSAAGCLLISLFVFFALVEPANRVMASWPLDAVPVDWTLWRDRWEFSHAVRALLMLGALITLIVSVLQETPGEISFAGPISNPPGTGARRASAPPRLELHRRSRLSVAPRRSL